MMIGRLTRFKTRKANRGLDRTRMRRNDLNRRRNIRGKKLLQPRSVAVAQQNSRGDERRNFVACKKKFTLDGLCTQTEAFMNPA